MLPDLGSRIQPVSIGTLCPFKYFPITADRYVYESCTMHSPEFNFNYTFMKGIVLTLSIAITQVTYGQILEDILDGVYTPNPDTELTQPLLLSMSPQSGVPYEVVVMLLKDFNPDSLFNQGMDPSLSNEIELYAVFKGTEQLHLPLFEAGVYCIVCLDEDDNYVGERVSIVVNDRFVTGLKQRGYAKPGQSMVVSTQPLRIGREVGAFVSYNSDAVTE